MSKRSNCKKPKCQNARTARSPNVKTLELQEAQNVKTLEVQEAQNTVKIRKVTRGFLFVELGICFLQFRLKRIVLNFQPDRSHPRGVNDLPKNRENPKSDTRVVIDGCFLGVLG